MENEPAFPSHGTMGEVNHQGMTLRDYFAAKAMVSDEFNWNTSCSDESLNEKVKFYYRVADAMLKARAVKDSEDENN